MQLVFLNSSLLRATLVGVALLSPMLHQNARAQNAAAPALVPSFSERAFTDSVGVNIHLHYDDTPYGRFDDLIFPKLRELGVRHVRDGAVDTTWQPFYDRHQALAAAGIGTTFTFDATAMQPSKIEAWSKRVGDMEAIEGTNEVDARNWNNWMGVTYDYQHRLYSAVKASPALRGMTVLGPSFVDSNSYAKLNDYRPEPNDPPIRTFMDAGNIHPYPGGRAPEEGIDSNVQNARRLFSDLPLQATESGYHNAIETDSGHNPTSEAAAAKYMPRLLADYFTRGISRTFLYELISSFNNGLKDPESNFGLLRYDGTEKLSFVALKNLLAVLHDDVPPASTVPRTLKLALDSAATDTRSLVLQRANGEFDVLLWHDTTAYDITKHQDIVVAPVAVTLRLDSPATTATIFQPNAGVQPFQTVKNTAQIPVQVADEMMIVRLRLAPTNAKAPAAPARLTANTLPNSVALSWAQPAKGLSYFVFRNDELVTTTNEARYTDASVRAGRTYRYEVQAVAPTGEMSARAMTQAITPALFPDLVVTNLTWTPANPTAGQTVTFRGTIKNQGEVASPPVIHALVFFVDGKGVGFYTFEGSLAPGESRELTEKNGTATYVMQPGQHTVRALADDVNRIEEGSAARKENNTIEKALNVP